MNLWRQLADYPMETVSKEYSEKYERTERLVHQLMSLESFSTTNRHITNNSNRKNTTSTQPPRSMDDEGYSDTGGLIHHAIVRPVSGPSSLSVLEINLPIHALSKYLGGALVTKPDCIFHAPNYSAITHEISALLGKPSIECIFVAFIDTIDRSDPQNTNRAVDTVDASDATMIDKQSKIYVGIPKDTGGLGATHDRPTFVACAPNPRMCIVYKNRRSIEMLSETGTGSRQQQQQCQQGGIQKKNTGASYIKINNIVSNNDSNTIGKAKRTQKKKKRTTWTLGAYLILDKNTFGQKQRHEILNEITILFSSKERIAKIVEIARRVNRPCWVSRKVTADLGLSS
jgi:hypothetical protein